MHAALGIWILSAVICMGKGDHHEGHDHADAHSHQDTAPGNNGVSLVTAENQDFAFRLYKKLAAHADSQGKNIFFSPISVSVALAALSVGAQGETHKQLFSGLGFNSTLLTQADVNQAFQKLLERSSDDTSEGTAVFVDHSIKPQPEFLETLRKSYLADGFNVDFTKTTESANTINEYVKEKTKGKIDKMVESLDSSTVMYLLSYIYFKGKWETPFDPKLTREDQFIVDENTKVPVQMMNKEETVNVHYDQEVNTSILHLPFNSSCSILLMLPNDMKELENAICPAHVTKWLKMMQPWTYDVYIPKFSIETSYSMNDVLKEMGMTDIFGDQADLSGIAEGQKLAVSKVVHKATLDIDEDGVTATAATGIELTERSLPQSIVLKFNRPFMITIIDNHTENLLFVGKIINPTI